MRTGTASTRTTTASTRAAVSERRPIDIEFGRQAPHSACLLRHGWQWRVTLVAIGLALSGALSACGAEATQEAAQTPAGTPSPLKAAAQAMQGLSSYTFEGDVAADALKFHVAGSFNAPNRLAETVTPEGATPTKIVVIGNRSYQLNPGSSTWTVGPGAGRGAATDPRTAFNALAQASPLSETGDRYSFRVSGQAASSLVLGSADVRGTATVRAGRIVALSYASETPAVSVDLTYAAFNTAPVVTPPPT